MKIKVVKDHPSYSKGVHEVGRGRGEYLVRMKIAVEAGEKDADDKEHKAPPKKAAPKKAAKKLA